MVIRLRLGRIREYDSLASAIAHSRELLVFGDYEKIEVWVWNARVGLVKKDGAAARG